MYTLFRGFRIAYFICYSYFELFFRKKYHNLVSGMEAMGPAFIKFGQFFSSMGDLIGPGLGTALRKLCDDVKPVDYAFIKASLEKEFSSKVEDLFSWISEEPVASASIAQIHKATTLSGDVVAIKVLKPNIEKIFKRDIRIAFFVARIFSCFLSKRFNLIPILKRFTASVNCELDLKMEAASLSEMRDNSRYDTEVIMPRVFWNLTSTRVLTMSWMLGVPLTKCNLCDSEFARKLIVVFFKQVYRNGFFHGDIHPGNIFVTPGNKVGLVDFGIVGRIDKKTKIYLLELIKGFLDQDYNRVAEIHYSAGYVDRSRANFASACRALGEPILGKTLREISLSQLLGDFFKLSRDFEIEINPNLVLIQKNLMFLESNCARIHPETNIWRIIEPLIRKWYKTEMNPLKVMKEKFEEAIVVLRDTFGENNASGTRSGVEDCSRRSVFFWLWFASIMNFFFILAFRFL
ncbi:phosphotransferase enzyme family protein [Neorickettsia helminthoeca str. Oregon]|uniref:Phosphotransferase enzyme family protein n=1 Tax=Neorickettsia helminthoeca str. Oregon TaxID=1286528 RepID=X5HM78_9RICK|nr:AarF/UbiB family protein [Neorickettsia helminthoeca]AHX11545.1 phosphotransferase enzyme family protein [Neorickettsia helminthoeca str. Oregon]